ncbi:hypothetical protein, partial [Thalassospira sp. UBA1131]|uniref:hypothetical protein n=1 Tax=Thalassospira sp. UBA1131 TaxID=1947672 RepID=UPI0025DC7E73
VKKLHDRRGLGDFGFITLIIVGGFVPGILCDARVMSGRLLLQSLRTMLFCDIANATDGVIFDVTQGKKSFENENGRPFNERPPD